jgi:PleD family two-component response regulator
MKSPKMKALIIEGDRLTGREVAAVLGNAGFETVEIMAHEDSLLHAELEQPSVIILDMATPGIDGFAAFKALRESHLTESIPIIAMTDGDRKSGVYYTQEDFEAAFDVRGPEGIIEKPINSRFLITCIMGVMG